MINCAPPDPGQPIAERLAHFLDCHSQNLGEGGFSQLSTAWLAPSLLTGCLTIYVALIAYRLLLGLTFGPRQAVIAAVRAGAVVALATSWPAYQTLVYRVITDGPSEVAALVIPADLPRPTLTGAAQSLDQDFAALQASTTQADVAGPLPPALSSGQQAPPNTTLADAAASLEPVQSPARIGLVLASVGALGAVRVGAGLLLALGPLFVTLGLFDATLGILIGWVRALVSVFVAAIGATVVSAFELGFLNIELDPSTSPLSLSESSLMLTAVIFGAATLAVAVAAMLVGRSFRLGSLTATANRGGEARTVERAPATMSLGPAEWALEPAGRAHAISEAFVRQGRRDSEEPMLAARSVTRAGPIGAAGRVLHGDADMGAGPERAAGFTQRRLTRARTPMADQRDGRR